MFGVSEKVFTVYEKPEAAEPTERVQLLREGFSFWAFSFGGLWLLAQRQWLLLAGYAAVVVVLGALTAGLRLPEMSALLLQVWVQLMFGFHAYDLQGWLFQRRGYRLTGVVVAPDEIAAERRYYDVAT
ncbi:MAG: DUF2628 domain-containing protein [Alphaproteobacteria bacterium]|nr:DUF2628 domain-containing protein [Alphaproteobacteria bacterium]